MESRQKMAAQEMALIQKDGEDRDLLNRRARAERRWKTMTETGLVDSESAAESQLYLSLELWSRDAGLSVSNVRSQRLSSKGELREFVVSANMTGSMKSIARFLHAVEASPLPLRVKSCEISQRGEKTEDLGMDIQISTLYRSKVAAPRAGERPS
jgi:Tfp pilus assembly protein PilO